MGCTWATSPAAPIRLVAADVTANTQAMLADLTALSAEVEEVTVPFDWAEPPGRVLYQAGIALGMAKYLPQWQNQMDPVTLAFAERGARFTLAEWRAAEWARTTLFRAVQGLFAEYDMLVMPTIARTALPVGHDAANDQVMVDGVPRASPAKAGPPTNTPSTSPAIRHSPSPPASAWTACRRRCRSSAPGVARLTSSASARCWNTRVPGRSTARR